MSEQPNEPSITPSALQTITPSALQTLPSGLYIVATPIGNLGDITMRAADILARCDIIACEDTRITGRLLKHLGLKKPMWRYDDHSDGATREKLLAAIENQAVVLVSDAGTPLISDPGYRLVAQARKAGLTITSLPGPCAAIAALTLSALPNDRFLFAGFLPHKDKARRDTLVSLGDVSATLIFYETAPRLIKTLSTIAELMPRREVAVARELTKVYEECRTASAEELITHYTVHPPKGEIIVLVGPPGKEEANAIDVDTLLRAALERDKPSQAAASVARQTGMDRKQLYARVMELRAAGNTR